jgi:DNA-binding response OmpR family regulator
MSGRCEDERMTAQETARLTRRAPLVMLIEPNAAIAALLARALSQEGYGVAMARDPWRGAEQGRSLGAALVVIDLRAGPGSIALAQALSARAAAPVVAMSSHGPTIHAFEDARAPLLRKPFAIAALIEAAAAALSGSGPGAGLQLLSALLPASASIL